MNHEYSCEYGNVLIRPLEKKDIEYLRQWRNNPSNTKYLHNKPHITKDMQEKWFENYLNNDNEIFFAIEETVEFKRIVGSLAYSNINEKDVEFGRFLIGDEACIGRHVGTNALKAAIKVAFEEMNKDSIFLHVYSDNAAALHVYTVAGFKESSKQVIDGKEDLVLTLKKE